MYILRTSRSHGYSVPGSTADLTGGPCAILSLGAKRSVDLGRYLPNFTDQHTAPYTTQRILYFLTSVSCLA